MIPSYCKLRKTNDYVALLDATKAFDHVNYCKLFRKLIDKNVSISFKITIVYVHTSETAGKVE